MKSSAAAAVALGRYGPGDEVTWPPYSGHPNDPRVDEEADEIREAMIASEMETLVAQLATDSCAVVELLDRSADDKVDGFAATVFQGILNTSLAPAEEVAEAMRQFVFGVIEREAKRIVQLRTR